MSKHETTKEPSTLEEMAAEIKRLKAELETTQKDDFKIPPGRFGIVRDGNGGYDLAIPVQRVTGSGELADCRTVLLGAVLNGVGGPAGTLHKGRAKTHGVRLLTDAECKEIKVTIPGTSHTISLGYLNGSTAHALSSGTIQEDEKLIIVRDVDEASNVDDEASNVDADATMVDSIG